MTLDDLERQNRGFMDFLSILDCETHFKSEVRRNDYGCSKYQFVPIIPLNGFSAPNFVILDEKSPSRRKFSDRQKFRMRKGQLPPNKWTTQLT